MTTPIITPRLGCAEVYRARIYWWDRLSPTPGLRLLTSINKLTKVEWERSQDEVSDAAIEFVPEQQGNDCCSELRVVRDADGRVTSDGIKPFLCELAIYRDKDRDPIWMGPVQPVFDRAGNVGGIGPGSGEALRIVAKDILAWADVRFTREDMWFQDAAPDRPIAWGRKDPAEIATWLLDQAFAPDNPGIREAIHITPVPNRRVQRTGRAGEFLVGNELRDLARSGLTFYTVGRSAFLHGDWQPQVGKRHIRLTAKDFVGGIGVYLDAANTATAVSVVGAVKPGAPDQVNTVPEKRYLGGVDPVLGLIERLVRAERITDHATLDSIGRRVVAYGNPPPLAMSLDTGSTLSPDAPVSLHDLIPSRWFLIQARGRCLDVEKIMRLSHLRVTWDAPNAGSDVGEVVQVAMVPPAITEEPPDEEG